MPKYDYEWLYLGLKATWIVFVAIFGACAGSLVNVLAYRMPRGIGVVSPPSRCPACETQLTWRENIPVLGWILLRGKCRFCKSKISARYPIIEAMVAGFFLLFFVLWYLVPADAALVHWNDFHWSVFRPDWYLNPPRDTWPEFVLLMVLITCLVAITLMDAETFTIDLRLTWVPAILALIVHPAHALWFQWTAPQGRPVWPAPHTEMRWAIAVPADGNWWWVGASIGGVIGLIVAALLLKAGLIRRSFADMEEWEKQHLAALPPAAPSATASPSTATDNLSVGSPAESASPASDPGLWIKYPHARREMFKEIVFLSPPVTLAVIGGYVAKALGAQTVGVQLIGPVGKPIPLWLAVLTGVLMGYLIGGGVVWLIRIGGSVAFGKEALGLGDVYMMAAVGACLGWIDSVLAFFGAAFVGLAWTVLGLLRAGKAQRQLPYGPFLAVATVLVLLVKPFVEWGLNRLLHVPPGEWPINLP